MTTGNCDETHGLYDFCPEGAYCPDSAKVNGCFVPQSCFTQLGYSDTREVGQFCYNVSYTDLDASQTTCHYDCRAGCTRSGQFTSIFSCNAAIGVGLCDLHEYANQTCVEINSCAPGYSATYSDFMDLNRITLCELNIDPDDCKTAQACNNTCSESCERVLSVPNHSTCFICFADNVAPKCEFTDAATCKTANSSILKSGETCIQNSSGCYVPYCTTEKYNTIKGYADLLGKTLRSCKDCSSCRSNSCETSKYGSYNDSCILTEKPISNDLVVTGTTGYAQCLANFLYGDTYISQQWNSQCSTQISVSYEFGSASANCGREISSSGALAYVNDENETGSNIGQTPACSSTSGGSSGSSCNGYSSFDTKEACEGAMGESCCKKSGCYKPASMTNCTVQFEDSLMEEVDLNLP